MLRLNSPNTKVFAALLSAFIWIGCTTDPGEEPLNEALGLTWQSQRDTAYDGDYWDVTWTGQLFVAVGVEGVIRTSPDGVTWTNRNSGTTAWLRNIAWSGKQLLVSGDGIFLTSKNGVTWDTAWTFGPYGSTPTTYDQVWADNRWLVLLSSGVRTSPDGETWTNHILPGGQGSALAWAGNKYVSVGGLGYVYTSTNGLDWTSQNSGTGKLLTDIVWTGTGLVAVGSNVALTSVDGVTWQSHEVDGTLRSVIWTGNRLIGVGASGSLFTSTDGVEWTPHDGDSSNEYMAVVSSKTRAVAVGWDGLVMVSP